MKQEEEYQEKGYISIDDDDSDDDVSANEIRENDAHQQNLDPGLYINTPTDPSHPPPSRNTEDSAEVRLNRESGAIREACISKEGGTRPEAHVPDLAACAQLAASLTLGQESGTAANSVESATGRTNKGTDIVSLRNGEGQDVETTGMHVACKH